MPKSVRYTIEARYEFRKNVVVSENDVRTSQDTFILDLERKALQPVANIHTSSDYVPAKVSVDASSSYSADGEIKKFIFDFGEGKPETVGDAIQIYEYTTPGDKKISITIVNDKNEQATIQKYVVLKDTPSSIGFSSTYSP